MRNSQNLIRKTSHFFFSYLFNASQSSHWRWRTNHKWKAFFISIILAASLCQGRCVNSLTSILFSMHFLAVAAHAPCWLTWVIPGPSAMISAWGNPQQFEWVGLLWETRREEKEPTLCFPRAQPLHSLCPFSLEEILTSRRKAVFFLHHPLGLECD